VQVIARTGWTVEEIEEAARESGAVVIRDPQLWFTSANWIADASKRVHGAVTQFHREKPLLPGISKEELRSRELGGAPSFVLDAVLGRTRTVVADGDVVRLASHRVTLQQDEETASAKIESAFAGAGLAVPSTTEVLARSGVEPVRAKSLLQILLKSGRLVRIGDELVFHPLALAKVRELLARYKGQRFSVPEFKEWTGVSRKYAIPLLEFLDREKITRRDGDVRVVL
jgi:selenocysteine-specific elongation factor